MALYDAIIIGTGQAGPSLAGRLIQSGMNVAIIERKHFGGAGVNTGYISDQSIGRERLCRTSEPCSGTHAPFPGSNKGLSHE